MNKHSWLISNDSTAPARSWIALWTSIRIEFHESIFECSPSSCRDIVQQLHLEGMLRPNLPIFESTVTLCLRSLHRKKATLKGLFLCLNREVLWCSLITFQADLRENFPSVVSLQIGWSGRLESFIVIPRMCETNSSGRSFLSLVQFQLPLRK